MPDVLVQYIAAWLLTYLMHSSLLLGGVFIASRIGGRRFESVEESAWRVALFGGVLTSLAQTLLLTQLPAFVFVGAAGSIARGVARSVFVVDAGPRVSGVMSAIVPLVVEIWAAIAIARVSQLLYVMTTARRRLAAHSRRASDGIAARAQHFAGATRVSVSVSDAVATPMVLGTNELCLPTHALPTLTPEELEAVLAHEVAHVVRRDPVWLLLAAIVSRALFVQPLNRLATIRLRAIAECSCDDWAVARTCNPIALASALARVTEWIVAPAPFAIAMASRDSLAITRVRRILGSRSATTPPARRTAVVATLCLLAATVAFVPGVSASDAVPQPHTIRATDDAGSFTVTMDRGTVTGMTLDGVEITPENIEQRGDRVHVTDPRGLALDLTLTPTGGFRWTSRPPVRLLP